MGNSRVRVAFSVVAVAALATAGLGTAHAMTAATTNATPNSMVVVNGDQSPEDNADMVKEYNEYSKKLEAHLKSKGIDLKFTTDEDGFYDIAEDAEISDEVWQVIEAFDKENGIGDDLGDLTDEELAEMRTEYNKVSKALEKLLKDNGHTVPFVTDDEGFYDIDPDAEISDEAWKLIEDYVTKHVGDLPE